MSIREHHTPRHAAGSEWQEPSGLRLAFGKVIGKEPLPGRGHNRRAKLGAVAATAMLALSAYGLNQGVEQVSEHLSSQEPVVVTTAKITTDPISLPVVVNETLKDQGFDPATVDVTLPEFAAEHQGQDPRTANHANGTYEVCVFDNGTATVTRVK